MMVEAQSQATLLSESHIVSLEKVAGLSATTLMSLTQISLSLHWEKERNMNSVSLPKMLTEFSAHHPFPQDL